MEKLDKNYWNEKYVTNQMGWDIGKPSTPIKEYIDQLTDKDIRILIPGAGNAYEAEYLLDKGFTYVTILDFAPEAIAHVAKRLEKYPLHHYHLLNEDFFKHVGLYDMIIEQTFFCAIDPALRLYYADKIYQCLEKGGKWVGVLFNTDFDSNPPFGGHEAEYRAIFSVLFDIQVMEEAYNSIDPRKGKELWVNARRK
jgi:hypothetical protein